ncbi:MAG TPA: alpha/beta hydrolase-fold protein, partial [Nitriliruptorales bacterium]
MRTRLIPLLAFVSLLATAFVPAVGSSHPGAPPEATVTVEPGTGVVALAFDSAALGRRTTTLVWLPDAYEAHGKPWPTAYFLHGELPIGGSARAHADRLAVPELGDRHRFLLVVPDADEVPACATCVWIDGRNDLGVDAETHLHHEVVPLVESLFNVRSDRAGRAILGTSMGATGALIQGARHPDRFAFIGAMSPLLDLAGQP